jgi:hypothetical protein
MMEPVPAGNGTDIYGGAPITLEEGEFQIPPSVGPPMANNWQKDKVILSKYKTQMLKIRETTPNTE